MVEVKELGDLLKLPNLEEETIKLINERMRALIGDIKPLTPAQQQEVETLMTEYLYGAAKKVGEG